MLITENISFTDYASHIRLPNCPKLVINQKNEKWRGNLLTWSRCQFFWRCFVFLVKFNYSFKFHVISSLVLDNYFYKGLTRNLEIGKKAVLVLSNIWRQGKVRDTKFGTNVSNKMLLNAAKGQGFSFYRFWVINGKLTGGWNYPHPLPDYS